MPPASGDDLRCGADDQHRTGYFHRFRIRRTHTRDCADGSSLNPQTDDPEFATDPRHEFNFWFDPEARISCCVPIGRASTSLPSMSPSKHRSRRRCSMRFQNRSRRRRATSLPGARTATTCGRTGRVRVAQSHAHHEGICALHGRRSQPRPSLRRHADMDRKAETWNRCAFGPRTVDVDLPRFQKMFVGLMTGNN